MQLYVMIAARSQHHAFESVLFITIASPASAGVCAWEIYDPTAPTVAFPTLILSMLLQKPLRSLVSSASTRNCAAIYRGNYLYEHRTCLLPHVYATNSHILEKFLVAIITVRRASVLSTYSSPLS
jgi:hypothetical protein